MGNKSSVKKIIILVAILALPGFLYYLLQEKGKNRYRPLDIYGPKQVAGTFHTKRGERIPDTIYHRVRDFKLLSSVGDSLGFPTDSNQIVVVNFFFTKCKSFCPEMNSQMERVVSNYPNNKRLLFYSISVDPGYDTKEVLRDYATRFKVNSKNWYFLTGNPDFIFQLAKKDFLVDVFIDTADTANIIHSSMFILIDSHKRIRGYYDSTSKDQVNKLIDEIKVQLTEEIRDITSLSVNQNVRR